MAKQAWTVETIGQDLPHVLGFLSALDVAYPQLVDTELLKYLKAAVDSSTVRAQLAEKLNSVTQQR
jgi:hypothetical protein